MRRRAAAALLAFTLAWPTQARAGDDEPRSRAMLDAGIAMILVGAIGIAVTSIALPLVLSGPDDGCCSGLTNDNIGTFAGLVAGLSASAATFIGGFPVVYFGARHKGNPNVVITATGLVAHF